LTFRILAAVRRSTAFTFVSPGEPQACDLRGAAMSQPTHLNGPAGATRFSAWRLIYAGALALLWSTVDRAGGSQYSTGPSLSSFNVFPVKGGDFRYRRATFRPANFDIPSTVDVAILQRPALTTSSLPRSKHTQRTFDNLGGATGKARKPETRVSGPEIAGDMRRMDVRVGA
jgi:hypothetical protein